MLIERVLLSLLSDISFETSEFETSVELSSDKIKVTVNYADLQPSLGSYADYDSHQSGRKANLPLGRSPALSFAKWRRD
jgi:hypothetical protein